MTELQWPPAAGLRDDPRLPPPPAAAAGYHGEHLSGPIGGPPRASLGDSWLGRGIGEVLAAVAGRLDDGARPQDVLPLIREAVRAWAERQVRAGAPVPAPADMEALAQAVYDQRYGLGPLSGYLRDPQVENVDVNGCDQVWVTYSTGERVLGPPVAASDDALVAMIRNWAARGGQTARDFSAAAPLVNVALAGGARMTATMSVTPRPCVSLRRHGHLDVTLGSLIQLGTVDATVAGFLAAAVRGRCNIIVTGGVNAGKTTMLRGLASEIPPQERVATLESEYELFLHTMPQHPDVIAFEAREPNSEGAGAITLHDLVAHALRHNPQRIIVGEVRRAEIMPMLEAMNSGQEGSMCTLHANSPVEAFDRILILSLRGGMAMAERAVHILAGMAIDIIVHVRKGHEGGRTRRYVTEILEVMPPGDTDRPAVNRLFLPTGQGGRAVAAHTPSPQMLERLVSAGFDPALLDRHNAMARSGLAMILLAALAGAITATGLVLLIRELTRRRPAPGTPPSFLAARAGLAAPARRRLLLSVPAALAVLAITRWPVAAVATAALVVFLPQLTFVGGHRHRTEMLEGLEQWIRRLADMLTASRGLEDAIQASARSAPAAVADPVAALASRLSSRAGTEAALRAFAAELDDPAGDRIAAALIIATGRRGGGARDVLSALAVLLGRDVAARREIEAERAQHRTTVRWITIFVIGFTVFAVLNHSYSAPYGTVVGQVVLAAVAGLYAAGLAWLHRLGSIPAPGRFLDSAAAAAPVTADSDPTLSGRHQ